MATRHSLTELDALGLPFFTGFLASPQRPLPSVTYGGFAGFSGQFLERETATSKAFSNF